MKLVVAIVVAGCTKDPKPAPAPAPEPGVAFAQPPMPTPPSPAVVDVKVELTAVTLADECGGSPPMGRPPNGGAGLADESRQRGGGGGMARGNMAERACEQTSMQLSIASFASAKVTVKSVELLDEKGASLGMLTASKPTRWTDAASRYDAWDEALEANANVNVSYVLQQPSWSKIGNRWNRMFVLKTVVSVGGVDRSLTKNVTTQAQVTLPPNVRT